MSLSGLRIPAALALALLAAALPASAAGGGHGGGMGGGLGGGLGGRGLGSGLVGGGFGTRRIVIPGSRAVPPGTAASRVAPAVPPGAGGSAAAGRGTNAAGRGVFGRARTRRTFTRRSRLALRRLFARDYRLRRNHCDRTLYERYHSPHRCDSSQIY